MILKRIYSPDSIMPTSETSPLYETANGSAVFCTCCNRVEMMLGNAVLYLQRDDFASVLRVIDGFDAESAPDSPRRDFVIRTEHDDAAFAFTRREVLELRGLVVGARGALRLYDGLTSARFDARELLH